jgi:UDP-GlcNAc:undecaprenyl-phosphate/decaprenyl-phosphate GlcNAc-1-phosphate transferase
MYEKTILLFLLVNFPIVCFFNQLVHLININDHPDNVRKLHKKDVPLFGGILIIYNLTIFLIADFFLDLNIFQEISSKREYLTFTMGVLFFFFIGIFDDKYNLSANKKLFLNFFILLFLTLLDDNLVVKQLTFSFIENPIYLNNFSHLFTILCILLFINAINMFDGINLQTGTYCIIIFTIFIFKDIYVFISAILILSLILFLFYNFSNKIFLGDSGTHILAFLISYILIKSYNFNLAFTVEEIFIILSFPGLDMFRLFVIRVLKGKNPFSPDRNHIHHLIQKKFNKFQTFLIIQACIILNIVIYYITDDKLVVLFLTIFTYLALYIIFNKKGKSIE